MNGDFLPSRLPIIQAPMAGSQGVELCVRVAEAGGLGSLPAAMLTPALLSEQIGARSRANARADQRQFLLPLPRRRRTRSARPRWRAELHPDYAEAGLAPPMQAAGAARAPFDAAMAEVVEAMKPRW